MPGKKIFQSDQNIYPSWCIFFGKDPAAADIHISDDEEDIVPSSNASFIGNLRFLIDFYTLIFYVQEVLSISI